MGSVAWNIPLMVIVVRCFVDTTLPIVPPLDHSSPLTQTPPASPSTSPPWVDTACDDDEGHGDGDGEEVDLDDDIIAAVVASTVVGAIAGIDDSDDSEGGEEKAIESDNDDDAMVDLRGPGPHIGNGLEGVCHLCTDAIGIDEYVVYSL